MGLEARGESRKDEVGMAGGGLAVGIEYRGEMRGDQGWG